MGAWNSAGPNSLGKHPFTPKFCLFFQLFDTCLCEQSFGVTTHSAPLQQDLDPAFLVRKGAPSPSYTANLDGIFKNFDICKLDLALVVREKAQYSHVVILSQIHNPFIRVLYSKKG